MEKKADGKNEGGGVTWGATSCSKGVCVRNQERERRQQMSRVGKKLVSLTPKKIDTRPFVEGKGKDTR